jgi:hypothetical protein
MSQPLSFRRSSVPLQSGTLEIGPKSPQSDPIVEGLEILDTDGLARKLNVPPSWIRQHVQGRTPAEQRIPHLKLGRYIRFQWGSSELARWLEAQKAR